MGKKTKIGIIGLIVTIPIFILCFPIGLITGIISIILIVTDNYKIIKR